jgi:hypothetical protein
MSTDDPTEKIPTTADDPTGTAGTTDAPEPDLLTGSATYPTDTYPTDTYPAAPSAHDAAPPVPPAPAAPLPASTPTSRGIRVGTLVWGMVLAAVGVGVLALSAGYTLDVELAMIVLLGAAGAVMLVGSILKGRRRPGR